MGDASYDTVVVFVHGDKAITMSDISSMVM